MVAPRGLRRRRADVTASAPTACSCAVLLVVGGNCVFGAATSTLFATDAALEIDSSGSHAVPHELRTSGSTFQSAEPVSEPDVTYSGVGSWSEAASKPTDAQGQPEAHNDSLLGEGASDVDSVELDTETRARCCGLWQKHRIRHGRDWGTTPLGDRLWYAATCGAARCDALLHMHQSSRCCHVKDGYLAGKNLAGSMSKDPAGVKQDQESAYVFRQSDSRRIMRAEKRAPTAEPDGRLHLAILTSGIRERFLLDELVEKVVQPSIRHDIGVELYFDFVRRMDGVGRHWYNEGSPVVDPVLKDMSPAAFLLYINKKLQQAGGILAYLRLASDFDKIDPLPSFTKNRLTAYTPCCSETGLGVIRRLKQWQRMWAEVVAYEQLVGQPYSYVLKTREDSYWAHRFNLLWFAQNSTGTELDDKHKGVMYTKDCAEFGGLSDKVFMFDRGSAHKFFGNMYDDYYRLSEFELDKASGAEGYFKAYAEVMKLKIIKVPFNRLAVLDAQYDSGFEGDKPILCVKSFYVQDCGPVSVGPGQTVESCAHRQVRNGKPRPQDSGSEALR
eukprot:TRINITY_DN63624_c0_g1_i1.p1 TRINITY_DN63624_c0_g1~~TRINITY_DN63624_c0_g1_i1.p1  ORF type:complete len:557 (-),score=56.29 TRINITY_DN63624_c0_g1_i1:42-1712(-)